MHAVRVSSALLWCWALAVVGCSGKPQEEKELTSRAAPVVVEGWEGTGAMPEAHKYHAGVVLQSGKVLVVGGYNGSGYLSAATVYDPAAGSWTAVAPLVEARQGPSATLLDSGKVLVTGGENASGRLSSATLYDPATNTWSSAGSFASGVARAYTTATLLPSSGSSPGKVLVAGGLNNGGAQARVDVYDPGTGTWSLAANMGTPRRNHTATLLPSGKVLVVGGTGSGSLATAELYDPASNKWTAAGTLATARYNHTATLLASGKVLVVGGRNSGGVVGTAEEYDPGTNTWSVTGPLGSARELHTATLMSTGKVLVAGGQNTSVLGSGEVYDPVTRTWSATTALASARYAHVAVALDGPKKVLVVGGIGSASLATAELYVYDACAGVSCNSAPEQCYEAGTCALGVCGYAPKAAGATCDDGNAGTINDVCNGAGSCAGVVACTTPPDACHGSPGTYANGACTYPVKAAGTACDDANACTTGDVCNGAGVCGGAAVVCNSPPNGCYGAVGKCSAGACSYTPQPSGTACTSDNDACTSDVCNGSGACGHPLAAAGTSCGSGQVCNATGQCLNGCWIGGAYYAAGATNPSGDCQVCDTAKSTTAWSTKPVNTSCRATAYGSWSNCEGFSGPCVDTGGSQSRTVTTYACTSTGTCAATTSSQTQACSRYTEGSDCLYQDECSECSGFDSTCDQTGTKSCSKTRYTCSGGTCNPSSISETWTEMCPRETNGMHCGAEVDCAECRGFSDICDESGTKHCTGRDYECSAGTCQPLGFKEWEQECSINKYNQVCEEVWTPIFECAFPDNCATEGEEFCKVETSNCYSGSCVGWWTTFRYRPCTRPRPPGCPG